MVAHPIGNRSRGCRFEEMATLLPDGVEEEISNRCKQIALSNETSPTSQNFQTGLLQQIFCFVLIVSQRYSIAVPSIDQLAIIDMLLVAFSQETVLSKAAA